MKTIIQLLAEELGCKEEYVNNVVTLLDEGNTIPFIARYRKEAHGAIDDTALRTLETRLQYLRNLQQRRDEVKSAVEAHGTCMRQMSKGRAGFRVLSDPCDCVEIGCHAQRVLPPKWRRPFRTIPAAVSTR